MIKVTNEIISLQVINLPGNSIPIIQSQLAGDVKRIPCNGSNKQTQRKGHHNSNPPLEVYPDLQYAGYKEDEPTDYEVEKDNKLVVA
eukprot:CAMPEP_0179066838 /NCGR_PEP_ID=MMETSP0796-20121207/29181_1 /TAXON_ID=73915 /ORGANISM="Pyrodinium bahamense, Strain pbaha01" /LENGTH=86 /DNA_ID=CAMNT_0020763851 /DNA_START=427 /DNA_END=687 /DNA_ORIENTATION=+